MSEFIKNVTRVNTRINNIISKLGNGEITTHERDNIINELFVIKRELYRINDSIEDRVKLVGDSQNILDSAVFSFGVDSTVSTRTQLKRGSDDTTKDTNNKKPKTSSTEFSLGGSSTGSARTLPKRGRDDTNNKKPKTST